VQVLRDGLDFVGQHVPVGAVEEGQASSVDRAKIRQENDVNLIGPESGTLIKSLHEAFGRQGGIDKHRGIP
jgi:hypothetical protein